MQEGAPTVRLGGQEITVRAAVEVLEGWSAHADRDELLKFAEAALKGGRVQTIFTALGEPASERFLAQRIHEYLGARAVAIEAGGSWEITKHAARKLS
jgi:metallo-beta-lactamase family protein